MMYVRQILYPDYLALEMTEKAWSDSNNDKTVKKKTYFTATGGKGSS